MCNESHRFASFQTRLPFQLTQARTHMVMAMRSLHIAARDSTNAQVFDDSHNLKHAEIPATPPETPHRYEVGRDFGAACAVAFKLAHPKRCGLLVLQNKLDQVATPEAFTALAKAMNCHPMEVSPRVFIQWSFINDWVNESAPFKNVANFKGPVKLLWPLQSKGRPDPALKATKGYGHNVAKALKTKAIDSLMYTDADVARHALAKSRKE